MEARSVPRPADVRQLQKKVLEEPSGCQPQPVTLTSLWEPFALSFFWGFSAFLGVDRSGERRWSYSCTLSTGTPSCQPGALSSPNLIFILGQVTGCLLKTEKTEKGALTSASPHQTQLAIAVPIKYRALSHCNALLATFPGKF